MIRFSAAGFGEKVRFGRFIDFNTGLLGIVSGRRAKKIHYLRRILKDLLGLFLSLATDRSVECSPGHYTILLLFFLPFK